MLRKGKGVGVSRRATKPCTHLINDVFICYMLFMSQYTRGLSEPLSGIDRFMLHESKFPVTVRKSSRSPVEMDNRGAKQFFRGASI